MFGAVSETPYDLRFRFLGIPVRVHPLFWLAGLLLAGSSRDMAVIVTWVACVFISILIHEYGHGLMAMRFDSSPSIVLWMGGGLCYNEAERQTPLQRLAVVLSGPGAGFVFCGVVMLIYSILYGVTPREHFGFVRYLLKLPRDPEAFDSLIQKLGFDFAAERSKTGLRLYEFLVQINLFWGLVNLLPIFPLDGGRVSEILLSFVNRYEGKRWGHTVSLVVAGLLAVVSYSLTGSLFLTVFFGYFAYLNFQILQSIHRAQVMGLYDEDWWRK
jgi:stage IV sporulation protein FB